MNALRQALPVTSLRRALWRRLFGRRSTVWVWLAVILGGLGFYGWSSTLPAYAVRCEIVYAGGACAPDQSHPVLFWIDAPKDTRIAAWDERFSRIQATLVPVDRGYLLEFDRDRPSGSITIYAETGLWRRWHTIKLRAVREAEVLVEARRIRNQSPVGGARDARNFLHQHKKETELLQGFDKARLLSLQGRLAYEADTSDTEALLLAAIEAEKEQGLLSELAEDVFWLSEWLSRRRGRIDDAAQLLDTHARAISQLIEWRPWEIKQRALHRSLRGDLQGALELLIRGRQWAQRTRNEAAESDVTQLGAKLLSQFGRMEQAAQWLAGLDKKPFHACRLIEVFFAQAEVAIQAREADPKRPLPASLSAPGPLIEKARSLIAQDQCDQPRLFAQAYTYLGRIALSEGAYAAATSWITQAQAHAEPDDYELAPDWLYVLGDSALRQKRYDQAKQHFLSLLELSRDPALGFFAWRAQLGLAQVAEHESLLGNSAATPDEYYREAEKIADRQSYTAPLGLGRSGFLGPYERGTALYLELLLRRGDLETALQLIRHARVRGILALTALERLTLLGRDEQSRYESALATFHQARAEISRLARQKFDAAIVEQQSLTAQQEALSEQARQAFERSLAMLGDPMALTAQTHRPPRPGELLFVCHPGIERWVCLGKSDMLIRHAFVDDADLDPKRSPALLAQVLLLPFADMIRSAERLTVIGYGALREIDIHLLPFDTELAICQAPPESRLCQGFSRPLISQLDVVYAQDLPGRVRAKRQELASNDRVAYLLFDPRGRTPEIQATATSISDAVAAAGFRIVRQGLGARFYGGEEGNFVRPRQEKVLRGEELRRMIAQSALFHASTHTEYAPSGGWRHELPLSDDSGLLLSDILTLPRVPAAVTLFTCESGRTVEEWGNVEGLGLAQAFLSRGSEWVLGASRLVSPAASASAAKLFYEEFSRTHDAARALRYLVEHSGLDRVTQALPVTQNEDVRAFRLYVP